MDGTRTGNSTEVVGMPKFKYILCGSRNYDKDQCLHIEKDEKDCFEYSDGYKWWYGLYISEVEVLDE